MKILAGPYADNHCAGCQPGYRQELSTAPLHWVRLHRQPGWTGKNLTKILNLLCYVLSMGPPAVLVRHKLMVFNNTISVVA